MPETAYPVADLTVETSFALETQPRVNPQELARQLKDISDAIAPVLAQADTKAPFGLQSIELSLTIGAEGGEDRFLDAVGGRAQPVARGADQAPAPRFPADHPQPPPRHAPILAPKTHGFGLTG